MQEYNKCPNPRYCIAAYLRSHSQIRTDTVAILNRMPPAVGLCGLVEKAGARLIGVASTTLRPYHLLNTGRRFLFRITFNQGACALHAFVRPSKLDAMPGQDNKLFCVGAWLRAT